MMLERREEEEEEEKVFDELDAILLLHAHKMCLILGSLVSNAVVARSAVVVAQLVIYMVCTICR